VKDPAKAGNFLAQRLSEMPSHNAVCGFHKEVGREEWEGKNEISIFSKGVFL
jgi:hypothetical protein